MILVAGLTPAWQQIMLFDRLQPGEVNRAAEVRWCASGKVLNVAVALHHLGAPCKCLSPIGGPAGESIRVEFESFGIPARWIPSAIPTRVCTTLLERSPQQTTELVENAAPLPAEELERFRRAYADEVQNAELVVLTGSLPQGTPSSFYRELLDSTPCPTILDVRGPELLQALDKRPTLVKPNREELGKTVGRVLQTDTEVIEAMHEIRRRGAEWVVITDGKNPLFVLGHGDLQRLTPPAVEVVNPIGSGDCLAAGIAWGLHCKREPLDAIRLGMAAAAENVGRLLPARLTKEPRTQ